MFRKNWSKDKGPCPRITAILRIINPALYERYLKYHSQLSWWYQGKKQYYHGTKLSCNITEYLELCNSDSCGICGISQQGFDPSRISRNRWQRFGEVSILRPILQSLTTIHCVAGTPVFHQELVCVVSCFVMWHLEEVTHCDVVIQTFRGHRRGMIVFMARVNSWDCLEISIMMK